MPAPFPLVKLGSILVKQISKPIANFAKSRAKSSPFFRTYVCMPPAQFYNWCEVKLKMWVLNLGKPVNIPVLSEQMAIELGANLLGEGIVFAIAAGALIAEYNRSSNKEAAKEAARKEELSTLLYQLQELYFRVEQQDAQLREIHRDVVALSGRKSKIGGLFNIGSKSNPEKFDSSSPPPSSPMIVPISNENNRTGSSIQTLEYDQNMGVILQAVQMMENEILRRENKQRENGIVTNALLYIENDLYRRPIGV